MRKSFYSKDNKLVDISQWDTSGSALDLYSRYGWEGAMAWGNLIHNELNQFGPGVEYGDIFLDIGANIGMSSIRAESCGAHKIYAIEPDPDVFQALEKNKRSNWTLENVAIACEAGEIMISKWPSNNEFRPIKSITLDDFFKDNKIVKIDYMKVDIEGAERSAFKNVSNEVWAKISKVFFELHGFSQKERVAFVQFVRSKNFINTHIKLGRGQDFLWGWK
jgi:FkbM family methyltransferase